MKGWGGEDNHQETIQATIDDAVDWARLENQIRESRDSLTQCEDCGEDIPAARQLVVKGCTRCVECQQDHDVTIRPYYNRRGSKDSQIR